VSDEHYQLAETAVPEPKEEGDILVKAVYISVDPYLRIQQSSKDSWEAPHPLGQVQGSAAVAVVLASLDKTHGINVGDHVVTYTGWQEYAVTKAATVRKIDPTIAPVSTGIGVLGMPGATAYFGFLDVGKPKAGETVVVSGAAGAVGSVVVQIAKIKGCRVVALAGSTDKLQYIEKELGADKVLNYKDFKTSNDAREALKHACPNGIDIYFDNTGGIVTDAVFELINVRARIIVCGQISQYSGNLETPELGPRFLHRLIYTRATIQGILVTDNQDRMGEMLEEMGKWIKEGKLKYQETILEGFDKLPEALNGLFHGRNAGKMLVKIP